MNEELKPCPFCGKQPDFIDFHSRIKAYICHVDGDHDVRAYGKTEEEAAASWNRRAVRDERVRELVEAAERYCAYHESIIFKGPRCDCPIEGHICGWPEYKRETKWFRAALRKHGKDGVATAKAGGRA